MSRRLLTVVAVVVMFGWGGWARAQGAPCKARQVEVFEAGGDAGLGHGEQIVGLRNVSRQTCTLFGTPRLVFSDAAGRRVEIAYAKNAEDYLFPKQPERLVTLGPGEFAHFRIATVTGDETLHFHAMRVLLPGDATPLAVGWAGDFRMQGINVSAIVAGWNGEDVGSAPTRALAREAGGLWAGALTLSVPVQRKGPFAVHLALRNPGPGVLRVDAAHCVVSAAMTNSAGKVVAADYPCGRWSGEVTGDGALAPGALATADVEVGDEAGTLCRQGTWSDVLTLRASEDYVRFAAAPVEVVSSQCSDSEHVGEYVDESTIRWTLVPRHGVRVGVAVRGPGDAAPQVGAFSDRAPRMQAPELHAGQAMQLRLYLDNLTDAPIAWRSGPDTFRVVVRVAGGGGMLPGKVAATPAAGGEAAAMLLPHRWQYVQTVRLDELYALGPGSYDVTIGPRTLEGDAAAANSPAEGWPYTQDSAAVQTFLRVIP